MLSANMPFPRVVLSQYTFKSSNMIGSQHSQSQVCLLRTVDFKDLLLPVRIIEKKSVDLVGG